MQIYNIYIHIHIIYKANPGLGALRSPRFFCGLKSCESRNIMSKRYPIAYTWYSYIMLAITQFCQRDIQLHTLGNPISCMLPHKTRHCARCCLFWLLLLVGGAKLPIPPYVVSITKRRWNARRVVACMLWIVVLSHLYTAALFLALD